MIRIRNYCPQESLPVELLDHGMPYLVPEWNWVVTPSGSDEPFALICCSFANGWLVIWRVLSIQPLPKPVSLYWFLEALPLVLQNARERGCVGYLSLLADKQETEARLARLILRQGGNLIPFKGSIAVALLN